MSQKNLMIFLRLVFGWYFVYAGLSKILDPTWSAAGYLNSATTFHSFYHWLASPGLLPFTNLINEWLLLIIGISFLLGKFMRETGIIGAVVMLLYYFPVLKFPYTSTHGFIIDEHIIYIAVFLVFAFKSKRMLVPEKAKPIAVATSSKKQSKIPKIQVA